MGERRADGPEAERELATVLLRSKRPDRVQHALPRLEQVIIDTERIHGGSITRPNAECPASQRYAVARAPRVTYVDGRARLGYAARASRRLPALACSVWRFS